MKLPKLPKIGRYAACIILLVAVFAAYELRLFQWQIVDGDRYEEISLSNRTDIIELTPARGQILDRNGEVLSGNRTTYNIVYNALYMDYSQRNVTIMQVVDLLEERGEKWRDRLPIVVDENGNYQFAENRESDIATLKSFLNLADYATAENCIAELVDQYNCAGYSNTDTRNVVSVRYSMTRDGYSRTNPYVIAEDVSPETVAVFSEREEDWPGIEARVSYARYYGEDSTLAPHVVGYTGIITDTQLEAVREEGNLYDAEENPSGYKNNDTMGRSGIEAAFEEALRGERGQETIYTDETGAVQRTAVTLQPKEGNNVQLTLDSDLQRVANLSLEKNIVNNTDAANCTSGAAVVLDVDTFGVLACSTYPSYDLAQLVESISGDAAYYNELLTDETTPMVNRALDGQYTPGSVFKPMVALAALQEGVTSTAVTHYCDGMFTFADMRMACTGHHGNANIYTAIASSCNVFFGWTGLDLGIDTMVAYAEYFGLGEATGVEIGENLGQMSNRQDYLVNHGSAWTDGVSAQAAIGQADSRFTPVQLATYCATMANGGVRLQTHFLDRITNYAGDQVVEDYQPVELYDAELSADVQGVVREAMIMCATSGTASSVFANYPVTVAAKTGTAETSTRTASGERSQPHLSFICYAPAYDPEIAVAVVMEYGNKGAYAQNVAKDILDQYFGYYTWDQEGNRYDASGNLVDDDGTVLKTAEELAEEQAREDGSQAGGDQDENSGQEDGDAQPSPSPSPDRDSEIPTTPFTGEATPSPVPGSGEEPSQAEATPTPRPNSPYYDPAEEPPDPSPSPEPTG